MPCFAIFLAAGCATPQSPLPPAATAAQGPAIAAYGHAMLQNMRSDATLAQLLSAYRVTHRLDVGLLVDPNGYVEKGFMVRASQPQAVAQAVLNHLINVNYGPFTPDMPQRPLVFLLPIDPPAGLTGNAAFKMTSIVLYQPNAMLAQRVTAAGMASYISRIDQAVAAAMAADPPAPGFSAALVMGEKPDGETRAWLVAGIKPIAPDLAAQITKAAEAAPPMEVDNGPVAFAIMFNAWGGGPPITDAKHPLPMPKEWFAPGAASNHPELVPDDVFPRIWP